MIDYHIYRWFYTSQGTLVVGGKSAEQNDELVQKFVASGEDYYVMHTRAPGSPFAIMLKDVKEVGEKELDECAVFTGCFSRAWRERKKKIDVDVFTIKQLSKEKSMKKGMWRVAGAVRKRGVELKLALTRQKGVIRAVPLSSINSKEAMMIICPGKNAKERMAPVFEIDLGNVKYDELMAALPAGGVRKCT